MIKSIVITKHGEHGYVASLRFKDSSMDEDVSHPSHDGIYKTISYILHKRGIVGGKNTVRPQRRVQA